MTTNERNQNPGKAMQLGAIPLQLFSRTNKTADVTTKLHKLNKGEKERKY